MNEQQSTKPARKTIQLIILHLFAGLLLTGVMVAGLFSLFLALIPTWGATTDEVARALPGDELTVHPSVLWTNGITIDASPEEVWPWIAQIGDTRGGFYSYTFIENQVGSLSGAPEYKVVYVNANEIHPEWQNPQPEEPVIQGMLKIRDVETGRFMLADSIQPSPFLWIWGWYLEPVNNGTQTRLLSRFAIEIPGETAENPVMDFFLNVGGFVMQQNMLQGIRLRAEGSTEPAWIEMFEIGLWLAALLTGLSAAYLYLTRKSWFGPLLVAVFSVLVIFVLTFVQPPIIARFLLDAGLVAGLVGWSLTSAGKNS